MKKQEYDYTGRKNELLLVLFEIKEDGASHSSKASNRCSSHLAEQKHAIT